MGTCAAAGDAEAEQLPENEGPVVVPLEGVGEGVQMMGMDDEVVDVGVGRRCWLLTWRKAVAQMDAWVVIKDGSGGSVFKKLLVLREKFGRKATSNDCNRCVHCTYGGAPSVGYRARQGASWRRWCARATPCPRWSR
jgi:hypothetical protein